ncbi:unnamed protein product [Protopolystoma xenopodis]|uniref:Uncharacterized protein n=1 Tax=Protopolystoma xenopodis TaxID=117903 RepID=A0A3S5CNA8_9PLAT|nr:unnamed protein product [Protopolystoma xenopodis]
MHYFYKSNSWVGSSPRYQVSGQAQWSSGRSGSAEANRKARLPIFGKWNEAMYCGEEGGSAQCIWRFGEQLAVGCLKFL